MTTSRRQRVRLGRRPLAVPERRRPRRAGWPDARVRRRLRGHRAQGRRDTDRSSTTPRSWSWSSTIELGDTDLLAPGCPTRVRPAAAGDRFTAARRLTGGFVVNLPDGLEVSLLPPGAAGRRSPRRTVRRYRCCVADDEDEPLALDLVATTGDRRGRRRHHPAAPRQHRRAHRPAHLGGRVRPDGARPRRSRSWPPRDLGRRCSTRSRRPRAVVALVRRRPHLARRDPRRRPGRGVRPDGPGLRPGRPARPGCRRRAAPARLPPRRGVAARPRHRASAPPAGPVVPSSSASPSSVAAGPSRAAGSP